MSCCATQKIDLDYLVRFTNAPLAGDPRSGRGRRRTVRARRRRQAARASTRTTGALADATRADIAPALVGHVQAGRWPRARVPSFAADRRALSRRRIRARDGRGGDRRSRRHDPAHRRASWRMPPSSSRSRSTFPGPTTAGRRHEKTIGRPVSMHAMRGISAHSNGFQTCRMLHLLQILLGSIDCPGGFRYKAPFPRPTPPPNRPASRPSAAEHAAEGRAARLPARPGGSAGRCRRQAAAHRQGLFAGTRRSPPTA